MPEGRTVNNCTIARRTRLERGEGPKRAAIKDRTGEHLKTSSLPTRCAPIEPKPYRPAGTRLGLKDRLDIITSKIVRKRDGRCVTCGESRPEYLTCSHFYKRRWVNVRFSLINCNCQCFRCNERHNENVWPYTNYFLEHYGTDVMHGLFELRNSKDYPTDEDLRKLLKKYRAMYRRMK